VAFQTDPKSADGAQNVVEAEQTNRAAPSADSHPESGAHDETDPLSDEEARFLDFLVREAISSFTKTR
jgi:hypothetical protein